MYNYIINIYVARGSLLKNKQCLPLLMGIAVTQCSPSYSAVFCLANYLAFHHTHPTHLKDYIKLLFLMQVILYQISPLTLRRNTSQGNVILPDINETLEEIVRVELERSECRELRLFSKLTWNLLWHHYSRTGKYRH